MLATVSLAKNISKKVYSGLKNHGTMSALIRTCERMYYHAEGVDSSKVLAMFMKVPTLLQFFHQGHCMHALHFLFCSCFVSVWPLVSRSGLSLYVCK